MKRLAIILFGVLTYLTLTGAGGCQGDPGSTFVDPKNTQIAFWGRVGTQNALYLTEKGDNTAFNKIADIPDSTSFVRLSPNRLNVLWIEKNFLFAMKIDGTNKVAFGAGMKTANADWGADSDVILIEPLGIHKISSTRMSDPTNSTILFNDVTEMNVSRDGTRMAFVPLGTRAVHFSNTDGSGLDALDAEPVGSAVMEPTFSLENNLISYTVSGGSTNVLKVHNLSNGTTSVVSGSTDILGSDHTPFQIGAPIAIGLEAGPSSFIYSLKSFSTTTITLDSATGVSIDRPCVDPSDNGSVVYTKGTGLYQTAVESESIPTLLSVGLDAAGYSDWR